MKPRSAHRLLVLVWLGALAACASDPPAAEPGIDQPPPADAAPAAPAKPVVHPAAPVPAAPAAEPTVPKGSPALASGLDLYASGKYVEAARRLRYALSLGLADAQRIAAHKYLAFIHCAAGRERPCREEFAKALKIDSTLELTPAEAGHPIWGKVFKSMKKTKKK